MYFNGLGFYEGFAGVPWHRYRALYVRFFLVLNVSTRAFEGLLQVHFRGPYMSDLAMYGSGVCRYPCLPKLWHLENT